MSLGLEHQAFPVIMALLFVAAKLYFESLEGLMFGRVSCLSSSGRKSSMAWVQHSGVFPLPNPCSSGLYLYPGGDNVCCPSFSIFRLLIRKKKGPAENLHFLTKAATLCQAFNTEEGFLLSPAPSQSFLWMCWRSVRRACEWVQTCMLMLVSTQILEIC